MVRNRRISSQRNHDPDQGQAVALHRAARASDGRSPAMRVDIRESES
jgi:hypothetical protein